MLVEAYAFVTDHDEFVRIRRAVVHLHNGVCNHFIGVLCVRTIGAGELHPTVMTTELVLMYTLHVWVNHPASVTDTGTDIRVSVNDW